MKYYLKTPGALEHKCCWIKIKSDWEFASWETKDNASQLTQPQMKYLVNKHWYSDPDGIEVVKILEYENIEYLPAKRQIRIKDKLL